MRKHQACEAFSWLLGLGMLAVLVTFERAANAEPPPPVDVVIPEATPPHRALTLEFNPLALLIERVSANVILAPGDHHALVLSPFFTWASTVPYATAIDAGGSPLMDASGSPYTLNVLRQTFKGFGGELGYRYYAEKGGPRGFFAGPSLLLAAITATAGNGSQTSFFDLGIAADIGYEALIADAIAVSVGGGIQYSFPSQSIPPQQEPAAIVANAGVRPRLLLSAGYAF